MLIPSLLFASAPIVTGLLNGSLVRYGGVIRESGTGRIVKHLAESGGLTNLIMGNPLSPILGGADVIINTLGHLATHRKLEVLQRTATEILGVSQIAAGASVLNLGVSAIGFGYMHFRMNQLQSSIIDLKSRVEEGFEDIGSKLDVLSGQLAYLQILAEDSRAEILGAISDLHRAIFIQTLAKLQAELASLHRFPDTSPRDTLKVLCETRTFFIDQAHQIPTNRQPRHLLLADIALKGWAVSLATESQLLIKHGYLKDAADLLDAEVPRFRQLSQRWCSALIPDDRPQLQTAYTYMAPGFSHYISTERIQRIARLSPADQSLTLEDAAA
ncbi:MAG: hypothetical protein HC924_16500 [Synechococcaceae cyanobacterium SM2_3_2]|nr:hypothetical protein [Synechococcaceae cyanobacterium SM2_3_2]